MLSLVAIAAASEPGPPPESRAVADAERAALVQPRPAEPGSGFRFLGLVQMKATGANIVSTNPFIDGQVIGTLGGLNGMTVGEDVGFYAEQRVVGFFGYAPPLLDNHASLTAAFEADWGFGDQAYATSGNVGGGFGADTVNLQTRRMHVTVAPDLGDRHALRVHAGLQFLGDSVNDPTASRPDELLRSGGRLMFFGSEAAGVAAYGRLKTGWGDRARYRLGAFTLWERGSADADDVWIAVADAELRPAYATTIGVHAWFLRDRSGGQGGVLGLGPTSVLSEAQGGPRLDLREDATGAAPAASADLSWLALDAGYNNELRKGRFGATGFVLTNIGTVYGEGVDPVAVRGGLLDAELRYRWAEGEGSVLRLEALATTGDDPATAAFEGVFTGNSYGVAGAVYLSHGCMLLFPDRLSINRLSSAVQDVSAAGQGMVALTGTAAYDVVPGRLTAQLGGGHARGEAGVYGTELNAAILAEPYLFLRVGLHGAMLMPGDAPNPGATAALPDRARAAYLSLDWLVL